ncbi:hypothetical protein SAMN05216483_3758 [Streptomyces sp. 2131.1]|nr:hypothetical protein SAMN05216483_3758 [Streptomyces sp. 2131.1]
MGPAAQAADEPLVEEEDEEADDVDAGAADDFVSDDVEEPADDDPEPDVFEAEDAGVLLDEEPRLSFR